MTKAPVTGAFVYQNHNYSTPVHRRETGPVAPRGRWCGVILVYLEQRLGGLFLEEESEVASYEDAFVAIKGAALTPSQTQAYLKEQISLNQSH